MGSSTLRRSALPAVLAAFGCALDLPADEPTVPRVAARFSGELIVREPLDADPAATQPAVPEATLPLRSAARPNGAASIGETAAPHALTAPSSIASLGSLSGYSTQSLRLSAVGLIDQASKKLASNVHLTAGAMATEALQWIAQAADRRGGSSGGSSHGGGSAGESLTVALTALREAEDFVGRYGTVNRAAIARMVRSHETPFLKNADLSTLTGLAAADVYLDGARQHLASLAADDPLAAEAVRILAQSYRLREGGTPFGLAASVHLMRAAADSVPEDERIGVELVHTLRDAGLASEARWEAARMARLTAAPREPVAGEHDSRGRVGGPAIDRAPVITAGGGVDAAGRRQVELVQLSPEEFAAISSSAAGPPGVPDPPSLRLPAGTDRPATDSRRTGPQQNAPAGGAIAAGRSGSSGGVQTASGVMQPEGPPARPEPDSNPFSKALSPIRQLWQPLLR